MPIHIGMSWGEPFYEAFGARFNFSLIISLSPHSVRFSIFLIAVPTRLLYQQVCGQLETKHDLETVDQSLIRAGDPRQQVPIGQREAYMARCLLTRRSSDQFVLQPTHEPTKQAISL